MTREEQEVAGLRAAFAQPDGAPSPDDCPPPERLWAAAAGELGPAEIREVVEHMALCAACAEEWRLAVELGAPVPVAVAPARWKVWLPMAAALAAVGLGIPFFHPDKTPKHSETRGGSESVRPLVIDGSPLEREHFVLRWSPASTARSYTVVVQDATSRERFRIEGLTAPRAEVPVAAFSGLGASDLVYWQVITSNSDGTKAYSKAWSVRLR